MGPLRLAADQRGDVELLSQAVVIKINMRVALEPQKRCEGRRLGAAEGVMQLDALFEQLEMGAVREQRRDADAACDQQVLGRMLGRRKVVRRHGDRQLAATRDFLVHVFRAAFGVWRPLHGDEVDQTFAITAIDE